VDRYFSKNPLENSSRGFFYAPVKAYSKWHFYGLGKSRISRIYPYNLTNHRKQNFQVGIETAEAEATINGGKNVRDMTAGPNFGQAV
jgi:hypothetical protein